MELATVLNLSAALPPSSVMAAMHTMAINATSNAYSTSDAPCSSIVRCARTQVRGTGTASSRVVTPTLGGTVFTEPVVGATIATVVGEHHGPLESFRHAPSGLILGSKPSCDRGRGGTVAAVTPEECLIIYGKAWFEPDHARRIDVLRQCCTEDIVFMDPVLGRLEGLDAVSSMIGGYIGSRSGPNDHESADSVGVSGVAPEEAHRSMWSRRSTCATASSVTASCGRCPTARRPRHGLLRARR